MDSNNNDTDDHFDDSLEMDDDASPPPTPTTPTLAQLPKRFRPKQYNKYKMIYTTIQPKTSLDDLTIGVVIEPEVDSGVITSLPEPQPMECEEDTNDCTETDLTQALSWIRQELVS